VDRSLFRNGLAIAFCSFLAWRSLASVLSLYDEVRDYDSTSLAAAMSLSEAERIESVLDADYPLFTLLSETVPEDGIVVFVSGSTLPTVKRAMRIGTLLYPPRFVLAGRLMALMPQSMTPSSSTVFAVDLVGEEEAAPQTWEPVASGNSLRVWRYRAPDARP